MRWIFVTTRSVLNIPITKYVRLHPNQSSVFLPKRNSQDQKETQFDKVSCLPKWKPSPTLYKIIEFNDIELMFAYVWPQKVYWKGMWWSHGDVNDRMTCQELSPSWPRKHQPQEEALMEIFWHCFSCNLMMWHFQHPNASQKVCVKFSAYL